MRFLLDTSAFIAGMAGHTFPRRAAKLTARTDNECIVSIVSAWEIILKRRLGINVADIQSSLAALQAEFLPIRILHLDALSRLPFFEDHRDPFDRLLIAQAISEGIPIVSSDREFARYNDLRVIWD